MMARLMRLVRLVRAELMRTHIIQLRQLAGLVAPTDAATALLQAALYARAAQVRMALHRLETQP